MSSTAKYALLGGGALVLFLLLRSNTTGGTGLLGLSAPPVYNPTASNVSAIGSAAGGILSGLKGLFTGTAVPLSGGTVPNANDNISQSQALAVGAANPDPFNTGNYYDSSTF